MTACGQNLVDEALGGGRHDLEVVALRGGALRALDLVEGGVGVLLECVDEDGVAIFVGQVESHEMRGLLSHHGSVSLSPDTNMCPSTPPRRSVAGNIRGSSSGEGLEGASPSLPDDVSFESRVELLGEQGETGALEEASGGGELPGAPDLDT